MSDESSKPREFWIYKSNSIPGTFHVLTEAPGFNKADFHVIEKRAHDEDLEKIKLLEEVCAELMGALDAMKAGYSVFQNGLALKKEYPETHLARQALASAREKIGGEK